ncbi:HNH endonuclease, partial [Candidatus Saccharibacteria bacterium]|nr:HNH endonuclease [Candidatus Saccharibacteria bacterium]
GKTISLDDGIDIDHIVAKKNAWDSGGYAWDEATWIKYANDEDRVLIATSDSANRSKGSKDAADWLPENTEYWCKYIIQQIEIKKFYNLSVRQAEKDKMQEVLTNNCKTR